MRAVICQELGGPESLILGELPESELAATEVRIRVGAAGVNFPDTLIIQGRYQLRPSLPFAPGFEVVGEIIETGSQVRDLRMGQRVMALTSTGYGAFAEHAIVDAALAVPVPDSMSDVAAMGFYTPYGTAWHSIVRRGRLRAGDSLLVLGATGAVGLAAVQIGRALGARVIAVGSDEAKLKIACSYGADEAINVNTSNLREQVLKLSAGRGIDVCLDPVGGDAFDTMSRCMAIGGRLVVIGFASGRIPQLPVNLAMLKNYDLVGVLWGNAARNAPAIYHDEFRRLIQLYERGDLKPHIHACYRFEQVADALNELIQRKVVGKVVLTSASITNQGHG